MKILHVTPDLELARVPFAAIHRIAQNVTREWAGSPAGALDWLQRNPDAAAVIVEVEAQSGAPFVRELRGAHLDTPVVVVGGSGRLDTAIAALNSGADAYLPVGPALDRELPEVVAQAMDRASRRARERAEMAVELAAQRRQLARENRTCTALQQQSLQLENTLARLEKRRADEAAAFAELLDVRCRAFHDQSAELLESRDALAAQLAIAMSALERERARVADAEAARAAHEDSERRHADEIAAAAARFSDLESRHNAALEEHAAINRERDVAYATLERRLAEAQSNAQNVLERAAADRAAAERELAVAVAARRESEYRANRIIAAALTREAELIGEVETESAAKAVAESHASAARMAAARGRDRSLLVIWKYRKHVRAERLAREGDLRRATAETERLQLSFDQLQSAFQQLNALAGSHATARGRLEAVVAELDKQLAEETERHLAAEADAAHAMARMRKDAEALQREIDNTRAHADALRGVADRVPGLEAQLEKTRQEKRRQFERAPYGLCRCSASGTIIEANHSFVALLGYRRAEDLRDLSWLTIAKERTGDLSWLLERARATLKAEAVETQWTTREGRHLSVRLQALVTSGGAIDIVAEDITALRALEERLRQAQKMEAVGRLATEVAVTCDAVLGDVVRDARDWMGRLVSADLRIPGERMVEELVRAKGFLRRLDSYGAEQRRALEPVSTQRVLRDLAPVLRRLVGDRISLTLPKSAGLFPVDVDAQRLERVLTNVVGYARERLPMGGEVKIDLATIAIGRRFAAGHSNVRPGDHVLITVTELPAASALQASAPHKARPAEPAGMELGVLVELISSCGGHLWLEAQPAGNMVLKIHLPKPAIKEDRAGRLSQWLRAASVANIVT